MKLVHSASAALLLCLAPGFAAVDLAGKVIQLDGLPMQGVVVSLTGTSLSDTTNATGEWSLFAATTGIASRTVRAQSVSNNLALRDGRIHIRLAGRDVFGRNISSPDSKASIVPVTGARRSSATGDFDTLIYSWNGKTILRDTITKASLDREGIVRRFDTTVNPAITHGYISDAQNRLYRTVAIGNQVWMAENLEYKVDSSWCYMDSAALCSQYGRFYQWSALFDIFPSYNHSIHGKSRIRQQGICPPGWRIPSDSDFTTLLEVVDSARSGILLRSTQGWVPPAGGAFRKGTDSLGFNAPASGFRNSDGEFDNLHTHVAFWTTTESDKFNPIRASIGSFVWTGHFYVENDQMIRLENYKDIGLSVRCIEGAGIPNSD